MLFNADDRVIVAILLSQQHRSSLLRFGPVYIFYLYYISQLDVFSKLYDNYS